MSRINFPSSSPYFETPQTSWYTDHYVYRPIPPDKGDTVIVLSVKYEFRPDKLSYDLYGTPAFWWVFCVRNPFLRADPIWSFVAGLDIMAPSRDYVTRIIGT